MLAADVRCSSCPDLHGGICTGKSPFATVEVGPQHSACWWWLTRYLAGERKPAEAQTVEAENG